MTDTNTKRDETLFDTIANSFPPMHPEGWKFVGIFAVVTVLLALVSTTLGWIGAILTGWCAFFFRDPIRVVPSRAGLLVSPADGVVQKIVSVIPPAPLNLGTSPRTRVSIFLNVFNVHVNRLPSEGTVTHTHYHPGAFFNASLDKASEENERQYVTMALPNGKTLGVVQIAGLIARRILCHAQVGQKVVRGERFGLIRFGSRVDVYLPEGVEPLVSIGQIAIGGETIIADMASDETPRTGVPV